MWLIKRYFGDKIGLYFAWLGFYTSFLVWPAIFGIIVFLYGVFTVDKDWNYPTNDICDLGGIGNITLCPICEEHCPFVKLSQSCILAKLSYFFDNDFTVVFAIFMSFWATAFMEFWKRRQAVIQWEWDLTNYEDEEQTRPEFEANVKSTRINLVTRKAEPYLSPVQKSSRVIFTNAFVLTMVSYSKPLGSNACPVTLDQ